MTDDGYMYIYILINIYIYIYVYIIPFGAFQSHGGTQKWMIYKGKCENRMVDN